MPAVPLALAQILERLEEIRYLLNRRTLVRVLAPVAGLLLGLFGLLVWSAARADAETFPWALGAALIAALALIAWAGLVVWRQWLDLDDAARFADDRGQMQSRLATAVFLSRTALQPALAPVLVADTLDRGRNWTAAAVVRRRFPYELAYVVAGAVGLILAVLTAQRLPPVPGMAMAPPPAPMRMEAKDAKAPPPASDERIAGEPMLSEDGGAGDEAPHETEDDAGETQLAGLSQQVRDAIRDALEKVNAGNTSGTARDGAAAAGGLPVRALGTGGEGRREAGPAPSGADARKKGDRAPLGDKAEDGEDSGLTRDGKSAQQRPGAEENDGSAGEPPLGANERNRDPRRAGEGAPYQPDAKDAKAPSMPGRDKNPQTEEGSRGTGPSGEKPSDPNGQNKVAQPNKAPGGSGSKSAGNADGKGTKKGGASATAGEGSEPEGLFASKGSAGSEGTAAQGGGTFKLTLGSFLATAPTSKDKPKSRERIPDPGSRAQVADPPALHPRQAADDALRRADIPPEYEEILRRIYSARPAK